MVYCDIFGYPSTVGEWSYGIQSIGDIPGAEKKRGCAGVYSVLLIPLLGAVLEHIHDSLPWEKSENVERASRVLIKTLSI